MRRATRTPFGSFAQVSACPTCGGSGQVIEEKCEDCGGRGSKQETKTLKIAIPAGVDNGTRLRVSGEGDAGKLNGPSGDLYVYLFVNEDSRFRRDGINVSSDVEIGYLQAILGCELAVETIDGEEAVEIPSGTQPETVLTLEGKGVPRLGNPVSRGNHLLTVKVVIPTKVPKEERDLLVQLAKVRGEKTGKGGVGFLGNLFT